jgi:hypothetical protein
MPKRVLGVRIACGDVVTPQHNVLLLRRVLQLIQLEREREREREVGEYIEEGGLGTAFFVSQDDGVRVVPYFP